MEEIETSENVEAGFILTSTIGSAATGFITALPLPIEWKAPALSLTVSVTGAVLLYWKQKVNKKKVN